MDWAKDLEKHPYLVVNTQSEEMIAINIKNQTKTDPSCLKGIELASISLPFWSKLNGIHSQFGIQSRVTAVFAREKEDICVVGTSEGRVFLCPYPCYNDSPITDQLCGNSSPITKLHMTQSNGILVAGSEDSVFVWKF